VLFGSFEFIFGLLPALLAAYWLARNRLDNVRLAQWVVLAASLFFIAAGSVLDLALLLSSLAVNWLFLNALARFESSRRHLMLGLAVAANLSYIGAFKYGDLFVETVARTSGLALEPPGLPLPLAISFYTFQLIALLVDSARAGWPAPPARTMALFFSFFPHLLAGPLLWFQEVRGALETMRPLDARTAVPGLMMFSIGLFKKAVVADGLASLANAHFGRLEGGHAPSFIDAWGGTLAYTFQIYFDFSGYSDMAVGLALFFGVALPINFFSPYKALSIIDFWRRWHMTLSRFLREYLYFALGGNRRGQVRRWINLMLTMTIGGLWHGASWNFALWGAAHGTMLAANHAWRGTGLRLPRGLAWAATFTGVMLCWVLFRTQTTDAAIANFSGLVGLNGIALPPGYEAALAPLAGVVPGLRFAGDGLVRIQEMAFLAFCAAIAFAMPNSEQLVRGDRSRGPGTGALLRARMGPVVCGALGALGLMSIFHPVAFIYFRF